MSLTLLGIHHAAPAPLTPSKIATRSGKVFKDVLFVSASACPRIGVLREPAGRGPCAPEHLCQCQSSSKHMLSTKIPASDTDSNQTAV
ncbi:hypothetical protein MCOR34_007696 [Pyricularia oryzae]|nr:hypothetical protein MCOR34_007696 [Pyricularia oryzae]KAI6476461.1 hypothetical protein MCOR17_001033 [Pyricularia oryzae]